MPPSRPEPVTIDFRCTLCGECCRRYVPLVTAEDARRIQRSLSIPYQSFLVFYAPDYFDPPLEEDDDRLFTTQEGPFALGLARVGDGCFFLRGNLCSIHLFTPMVCRQYPFEPTDPEDLAGPFQVIQDACWGHNAWDGLQNVAPVRTSYAQYTEERLAYGALVRQWNDDPGSAGRTRQEFVEYLGLLPSDTLLVEERR